MLSNTWLPRNVEAVAGAGAGGADKRMKVAKLTIPVEKSDAVLPEGGETGSTVPKMVMSSGSGLNWQLGVVSLSRLLGKARS